MCEGIRLRLGLLGVCLLFVLPPLGGAHALDLGGMVAHTLVVGFHFALAFPRDGGLARNLHQGHLRDELAARHNGLGLNPFSLETGTRRSGTRPILSWDPFLARSTVSSAPSYFLAG